MKNIFSHIVYLGCMWVIKYHPPYTVSLIKLHLKIKHPHRTQSLQG